MSREFIISHLRLQLRALDPVEFGIQPGSQIRGALYDALRYQSCAAPEGHHDPRQAGLCPVCWLMAREDIDAARGKDVPRAFTLQPPIVNKRRYVPGELFEIGLTLFGDAIKLTPYLLLALPLMGQQGVGYGRGRFMVDALDAVEPLTGDCEHLMKVGTQTVRWQSSLAITQKLIDASALTLPTHRLTLHFLTPTRLTENGKLVKTPIFRTIIARLLERLDLLRHEYSDDTIVSPYEQLTGLADSIPLVQNETHWIEAHSGSRRMNAITPISGFVGSAIYEGELSPFREWLLWGQSIQIGKDTVKGNGVFRVERIER